MAEHLSQRGELRGHGGWVTALATTTESPDMLISASRDKSIIVWKLTREEEKYGVAHRRLTGHSHFISDVAISSDGKFALSGSWDGTLRLWDIENGVTTRRFVGHKKDVLSVAFSADNRQIVSGSRDRSINLWNTLGHCKYTITTEGHNEWVSCVRFSPNPQNPVIVSAGWDKRVLVWDLQSCKLKAKLEGHKQFVSTVTVSPDGSLCASGGKDGKALLWDLVECRHLSTLESAEPINALCFSPTKYWLCAATATGVKIWDLESKNIIEDIRIEVDKPEETKPGKVKKALPIQAVSLAWSQDGQTLFAGFTDNVIRVYSLTGSATLE